MSTVDETDTDDDLDEISETQLINGSGYETKSPLGQENDETSGFNAVLNKIEPSKSQDRPDDVREDNENSHETLPNSRTFSPSEVTRVS